MKKQLSIAIVLAALSMSLGTAAGIKHFSKSNEVEQAQAALDDNTFLMYYAGDSSGSAQAGCYQQSTALSGNVSSNSITYATYTNYLTGFTPSSGGNNTRTFTIKAASTARVVSIPVRIAINVDAGKYKTVSSFGGTISVTRSSTSSQAAKVELFKDDVFSVNSSLSTTSTGALARAYSSGSSLAVATTAFTCNTVKQYYNKTTSTIPVLKDFLHLVFTLPTIGSNTQYTVGIEITSCTVSDSDEAVAKDNNEYVYSQTTFPDALKDATADVTTFELVKDVSLSKQVEFTNVTRTINCEKYKINCLVDCALVIDSGSNITFNGTNGTNFLKSGGVFHQLGEDKSVFSVKSGTLTINSGYYGALTSISAGLDNCGYVIKSSTASGTIWINGGVFKGTRCIQNTYGTNCYIGGGSFDGSDYTIYSSYANTGFLAIYNAPTFNKPIYTARMIYLNNSNTVTRLYYTGSGFSVTLATSMVSNNTNIFSGAQSASVYDNITITNLADNGGYVGSIVTGTSSPVEYGLKLTYRSCVPVLHLTNCTLEGDVPTMTYSPSSGTYSMQFIAKYGYYFEATKGTTVVEASGLSFTYEAINSSTYLGYYRSIYVRMYQSAVKADVEFTIAPLKSSYLTETENFINTYMYMNTYTENKGWCKDAEHHYFADAMAAYNPTTTTASYMRQILNNSDDPAIVAAKDRLSKWAAANGYHIDTAANGYKLVANTAQSSLINKASNTNIMVIAIVTTAMVSISVVGFVLVIRKKKHQ